MLVGSQACFVGPHSEYAEGRDALPTLHPGYRDTSWSTDAPGITPDGIRARVGARHLPLGLFLQSFLDAGFHLDRIEEPDERECPKVLAVRGLR